MEDRRESFRKALVSRVKRHRNVNSMDLNMNAAGRYE